MNFTYFLISQPTFNTSQWDSYFTRDMLFSLYTETTCLPGTWNKTHCPKHHNLPSKSQNISTKLRTVREKRREIKNRAVCKIIMIKLHIGIHCCWKYNPWQFPSLGNSGTLEPWYQGHWVESGRNYTPARTTKHTNKHSYADTQIAGTTSMAASTASAAAGMLACYAIWAFHPQQLTTQAKPTATEGNRNGVLYQHDGDLTVLDGTFGAVTSKAPFLLYGKEQGEGKEKCGNTKQNTSKVQFNGTDLCQDIKALSYIMQTIKIGNIIYFT
jgi:hypothetical protein